MKRLLTFLCISGLAGSAWATPNSMTVQEMVDIAVTIPGFSYWWGGSKWSPGASDMGKCAPNPGTSGGCPSCTHSGAWGADCSGFVGKAWQVDKPVALDVEYHPYSTQNFVNDSTWWTAVSRDSLVKGDALTYYKNGAGHIFLYEKGDPWGSMWAWECKGCAYGCTYGLRTASADFVARRRKLIAPTATCTAHCEGASVVDASCGSLDCAAKAGSCVEDDLGVRCISALCPSKGTVQVCMPDKKLGTCTDGSLSSAPGTGCGGVDAGPAQAADAGSAAAADGKAADGAGPDAQEPAAQKPDAQKPDAQGPETAVPEDAATAPLDAAAAAETSVDGVATLDAGGRTAIGGGGSGRATGCAAGRGHGGAGGARVLAALATAALVLARGNQRRHVGAAYAGLAHDGQNPPTDSGAVASSLAAPSHRRFRGRPRYLAGPFTGASAIRSAATASARTARLPKPRAP